MDDVDGEMPKKWKVIRIQWGQRFHFLFSRMFWRADESSPEESGIERRMPGFDGM